MRERQTSVRRPSTTTVTNPRYVKPASRGAQRAPLTAKQPTAVKPKRNPKTAPGFNAVTDMLTVQSPVAGGKANTGNPYGTKNAGYSSGAHRGTDFSVPVGTPVSSPRFGGVIKSLEPNSGAYGNSIVVQYPDGSTSRFSHLSDIPEGLKIGQSLDRGKAFAKSGNTGHTTGPHLDVEVSKGGVVGAPAQVWSGMQFSKDWSGIEAGAKGATGYNWSTGKPSIVPTSANTPKIAPTGTAPSLTPSTTPVTADTTPAATPVPSLGSVVSSPMGTSKQFSNYTPFSSARIF